MIDYFWIVRARQRIAGRRCKVISCKTHHGSRCCVSRSTTERAVLSVCKHTTGRSLVLDRGFRNTRIGNTVRVRATTALLILFRAVRSVKTGHGSRGCIFSAFIRVTIKRTIRSGDCVLTRCTRYVQVLNLDRIQFAVHIACVLFVPGTCFGKCVCVCVCVCRGGWV